MRELRELQMKIRQAVLGNDPAEIVAAILGQDIPAEARLQIYRNHVFTSLTEALKATFPVVCRLVDERFFHYAAHCFIKDHPPESPCLSEYGETFAAFLEAFPPCAGIPYIGDVARLEWLVNESLNAPAGRALDPARLAAIALSDAPDLIIRLDPSLRLMSSRWPVNRIWSAHQDEGPIEAVDLAASADAVRIRRRGDKVAMAEIDAPTFAFLSGLQGGGTLAEAVGAGLIEDPLFDVMIGLRRLIADGLIVDFAQSRQPKESRSLTP